MSVRVSLRGMLNPIRVDTSRRLHNVGFLAERLIYVSNWVVFGPCPFTLAKILHAESTMLVFIYVSNWMVFASSHLQTHFEKFASVTDFGNTVSNYTFCHNVFKAIIIL